MMTDVVNVLLAVSQILRAGIAAGQTLEQVYLRVEQERQKGKPNYRAILDEYKTIMITNFDEADKTLRDMGF